MNLTVKYSFFLLISLSLASCVTKKQYSTLQQELSAARADLSKCDRDLRDYTERYNTETNQLKTEINTLKTTADLREEQIVDLRSQVADARQQRDKQVEQVGDLAVLSKEANQNIQNTLAQLERKDKYIVLLQQAKSKADSINLALAVNLKGALKDGIEDEDIEVKVDKTVVFINLSDKMLYQSGSAQITPRAGEVLSKIATIVKDRPDLEVMVEGYTDSQPINTACMKDNWDLSVKRATAVVRALQKNYGINPDRLIAAGRGEYNALADNSTAEGRSKNRRTRIIILPKLNQFYDLLNPDKIPN
ncbi:MAG: OmpA family protein [Bacteroidota bacterium]